MKISMGADHAGYKLKEEIKAALIEAGHEVIDCGTASGEVRVDYPDWGFMAAEASRAIRPSAAYSSAAPASA